MNKRHHTSQQREWSLTCHPWNLSDFGATLMSVSGFLVIVPGFFFFFSFCESVCGQWQWKRRKIIYSLSKSLWLSNELPNISSAIKELMVVDSSHSDEMGTNKKKEHYMTTPFPICTYFTLLYTIEIYKYYKMSFIFTMSKHWHAIGFQWALFLLSS